MKEQRQISTEFQIIYVGILSFKEVSPNSPHFECELCRMALSKEYKMGGKWEKKRKKSNL